MSAEPVKKIYFFIFFIFLRHVSGARQENQQRPSACAAKWRASCSFSGVSICTFVLVKASKLACAARWRTSAASCSFSGVAVFALLY
jgi:hypothetical protein